MKALSVKIPDPLFHDLTQRAKASAVSQSDIVRSALLRYLHDAADAPPTSCAQRASRWIGMGEGPPDLATNPDHLRGVGQ